MKRFSHSEGSRDYSVYVPDPAPSEITGLIMMLHGCSQTPEDFAAATRMNVHSQENGFIVVYPHQCRGSNMQTCWNWFSPNDQQRDRGEPAVLASLACHITEEYDVPGERVFVAGLSAGAAMAVILGHTYPDIFSAVGAHSGLAYKSAQDVHSAYQAMSGLSFGLRSSAARPAATRTIVFHGNADTTVHVSNSNRIVDDVIAGHGAVLEETHKPLRINGKSAKRQTGSNAHGVLCIEHWEVDGLGHAWSGGSSLGTFADENGPDASAEMVRFFFDGKREVL